MTGTTTSAGLEITYGYNGEGKRILKTSNGKTVRYLYEGDKVILEVDGTGVEKARSVTGINQISRTIGGEVLYYLYNGHADVTQLTNTLGETVATYYYDAFGEIIDSSGSADNPIRYAGYQYDEETGLYYLNARMYDPTIARFLQEDTYTGEQNDPLSLNLYAYCMNNPLKYNDPTGHFFKELWDDAKEAASDFVETVESTVDTVVNYIDTKVEEACTYINDKVGEGFNYVESKFNISDSTPIYGAIKNDIKQKIGFVEGAYEEAISMVTGIASLLVKNNGVISPVRAYNDINNFASDPQAYMNKEIGKLDKIYDVVSNPGKVYDSVVNSINNYGKELEADPYKRGNLAGHAAVFVASFFVGAGEAKTAITAEKGINGALKAEKELNAFSKAESALSRGAGEAIDNVIPSSKQYIPMDANGNPIPLAKQRVNGQDIPLPDSAATGPHTVLGGKVSSKTGEVYRQSATFPDATWPLAEGKNVPWSEVHWSNHGRGDHGNPHQHIFRIDGKCWLRGDPTDFNK